MQDLNALIEALQTGQTDSAALNRLRETASAASMQALVGQLPPEFAEALRSAALSGDADALRQAWIRLLSTTEGAAFAVHLRKLLGQ